MGCLRKQLTCCYWAFVEALCGLSALGFWAWLTGVQKGRLNGKSLFLWGERLRAEVSGASVSPSHLVPWVPLLRGLVVLFVVLVFVSCWCFQVPRFLQLLHVLLTRKRISDRQGYVLDRLWRKKNYWVKIKSNRKAHAVKTWLCGEKQRFSLSVSCLWIDWFLVSSCLAVGNWRCFFDPCKFFSLQYFKPLKAELVNNP